MTDCAGGGTLFTFDHYLFCRLPGATAPTTPDDAGAVCAVSVSARLSSSATDWVHRSSKQFATRIFACDDANCDNWYGDSSGTRGSTSNVTGAATTDAERWVLEDVEDYQDTSLVITDASASASSAIFYPANFANSNYLAIWWSTGNGGNTIRHKTATSSGWTTFNNTSWGSETIVAQPMSSGEFSNPTHPWMAPVDEGGSTQYVRMFFHGGSGSDHQIWSIDSDDEAGTDFELECLSGTCDYDGGTCSPTDKCDYEDDYADGGEAVLEVCGDGTSACDYLDDPAHGRFVWDRIAYGTVDFATDEPRMLFTAAIPSACDGGGDNEIVEASWDGTSWNVATSGSCPEYAILDRHDPGMIPLPNDEIKAYVHQGTTTFHVCYWDGSDWGDCAPIELAFDDGTNLGTVPTDPSLGECLGNIDTIVYVESGNHHEGAFLHERDETSVPVPETPEDCFTNAQGIVFAEHRN